MKGLKAAGGLILAAGGPSSRGLAGSAALSGSGGRECLQPPLDVSQVPAPGGLPDGRHRNSVEPRGRPLVRAPRSGPLLREADGRLARPLRLRTGPGGLQGAPGRQARDRREADLSRPDHGAGRQSAEEPPGSGRKKDRLRPADGLGVLPRGTRDSRGRRTPPGRRRRLPSLRASGGSGPRRPARRGGRLRNQGDRRCEVHAAGPPDSGAHGGDSGIPDRGRTRERSGAPGRADPRPRPPPRQGAARRRRRSGAGTRSWPEVSSRRPTRITIPSAGSRCGSSAPPP